MVKIPAMKVNLKFATKWIRFFAPPLCIVALCFMFEVSARFGVWTTLFSPALLLVLIILAATSSLGSILISCFAAWLYLGFWFTTHLRLPHSPEELVARNATWFLLIFSAPLLLYFFRSRLQKTLIEQIAQHKEAQAQLQASEARARGLIEFANDAFIAMSGEGVIKDWNHQAEKTFGWKSEEVLGRRLRDIIIPERYREAHQKGMERYLKTGVGPVLNKRIEISALHRDGHEIPVELTIYPLKQPEGVLFGSFIQDISERKRSEAAAKKFAEELERKIQERTQELTLAYDQAKVASRLKDEFLATVSHEIRTPLAVILGYCNLLLESPVGDEERTVFLETIDRNAKAQMRLINDLLDVSKIISGKLVFDEHGVFDVNKSVLDAAESVKIAARAKNIRISTEIGASKGFARGDGGRIQQVLWNLLTNAVKFTPEGGDIKISVQYVGSFARICVSDTGKGIDSSFLPYVFERFRQEDATTTRSYGGLGIGLAIVRHIVEAHGGSCEVTSGGPDQGSTFTVILPVTVEARLPMQVSSDATPRPTAKAAEQSVLRGRQILIVDDQPDNRLMLRAWLNRAGAVVTEAESAQSAMSAISESLPDALISDISMPKEDGYQLIRKIRALEKSQGGGIPAIAFTAHARTDEVELAIRSGFDLHVARPAEAWDLVGRLSGLLNSK